MKRPLNKTCPGCGMIVRKVHDAPVAGIPYTIDAVPISAHRAAGILVEEESAVIAIVPVHKERAEEQHVTSANLDYYKRLGADFHKEHSCR